MKRKSFGPWLLEDQTVRQRLERLLIIREKLRPTASASWVAVQYFEHAFGQAA